MKIVHLSPGRTLIMLVPQLVIFMTTLSTGDGFHDRKETHWNLNNGRKHAKWTKSSVGGAYPKTEIPLPNKNADGIKFATKRSEKHLFTTPVRRVGKVMRFSRIGRQKLRDLIWRRSKLPFMRRPYWNSVSLVHPWYDTRLYKKQLTNNKDLEVDDEPYIVLPPDNTINTKEEAFKLDEGTATTTVASPKPSTTPRMVPTITTTPTTPTTATTPLTTPTTLPTTLPPITTPLTTTPPTTPPTTPTPPPTTKPTEKLQVINIQAGTPPVKRAFPTAANINLNLEIGDNEDASQLQPHESVPVTPTTQNIFTSNQQEESAMQPTPQIIIAPMPAGMVASQNQQPQIIMAQPAQTPPPPEVVFAPQPTAQPQPQYVMAAPPPVQPQPQYVMAAPQAAQPAPVQAPAPIIVAAPTPPPPPVVYQQPIIQPVPAPVPVTASPIYVSQASPPRAIIAAAPPSPFYGPQNAIAPQPQVSVSASPPASITVNSLGAPSPIMMSSSSFGMPSVNPFLSIPQGGPLTQIGIFQNPQVPVNQAWSSPFSQQLQLGQQFPSSVMLSSPLLSSIPQSFDPLLYSTLTGMFANAIRSSMIQPQPSALASALALAATQAQARNQPPDLLTAALTQALAQNIQQGIQPISNAKLVQALSQALSLGQPGVPPNTNPPANPPQQGSPSQQPPPLPPPPPPNQQQPPPRNSEQNTPYPQIQIPPYQVVPNPGQQSPPLRDTRSDAINNKYSVNKVGKALASALIKAAKKIASRNSRLSTRSKESHYRHHSRERERSFVPLLHSHSNYQTLTPTNTKWTNVDMRNIFAIFRPFWKRISSPCYLRGCHIFARCPSWFLKERKQNIA